MTNSPSKAYHYYFPFGDQVKKARNEKNYSQRGLCKKAGLNHGVVGKIELGTVRPSLKVLNKIGAALEIQTTDLFLSWITYQKNSIRLKSNYPRFSNLLLLVINIMNDDERSLTVNQWENKLEEFAEDEYKLAQNVKSFLLGQLSSTAQPKNGLKPLCTYTMRKHQIINVTAEAKGGNHL